MPLLTEEERTRVRYHLGYLGVQSAAAAQFGMIRPIQTLFLVESAMDKLATEHDLARVRRILFTLDSIEEKMQNALCSLVAEQVGTVKLREDLPDRLEREYHRWAARLADIFGVPLYQFSERVQRTTRGINVPVRS